MNVLVTGAAGLIGKKISSSLKENYKVIEADIMPDYIKLDVTNEKNVKQFFKDYNVDSVINCAYPRTSDWAAIGPFEMSNELFCNNVNLQLGSAFNVLKYSCQHFRNNGGGSIVFIGSVSGVMNPRFDTYEGLKMTTPIAYSAIKSGLQSMCSYMAKYLKGENIRINVVSPSGIFDHQPEIFIERYKKYCLNKGMLDSEDLVGTIKFLISDESKYINGQNIIIDDGFTL